MSANTDKNSNFHAVRADSKHWYLGPYFILSTATGIFGQLYLAILIAKFVGIDTAQTLRESE